MPLETMLVIAGIVAVFAVYMTLLVYGEVIAGGAAPEDRPGATLEAGGEAGAEVKAGAPAAPAPVAAPAPAPRVTEETHARWPETAALAAPTRKPAPAAIKGRTGAKAEKPKDTAVGHIG